MRTTEPNTTDATRGQSLRARVEARQREIQASLTRYPLGDATRRDLESALSQVKGLLTGDLDTIPHVVATELNTWLEATKHIDEHHRDKYLPTLEAQLMAWNVKLDELTARAGAAGAQAKADAQRKYDELKVKLDGARAKLEEAKAAGSDKWEALERDLERVWQDVEISFQKLIH